MATIGIAMIIVTTIVGMAIINGVNSSCLREGTLLPGSSVLPFFSLDTRMSTPNRFLKTLALSTLLAMSGVTATAMAADTLQDAQSSGQFRERVNAMGLPNGDDMSVAKKHTHRQGHDQHRQNDPKMRKMHRMHRHCHGMKMHRMTQQHKAACQKWHKEHPDAMNHTKGMHNQHMKDMHHKPMDHKPMHHKTMMPKDMPSPADHAVPPAAPAAPHIELNK